MMKSVDPAWAEFLCKRKPKPKRSAGVSTKVSARAVWEQWLAAEIASWRSITAVTLTLKQALPNAAGGLAPIAIEDCRRTAMEFGRGLDNRIFGRVARRFRLRLKKVFILEHSRNGRWHYHALIEPPAGVSAEQFADDIRACWRATKWGYDEVKITAGADTGWLDYSLKPFTKEDLEYWADGVELVTK